VVFEHHGWIDWVRPGALEGSIAQDNRRGRQGAIGIEERASWHGETSSIRGRRTPLRAIDDRARSHSPDGEAAPSRQSYNDRKREYSGAMADAPSKVTGSSRAIVSWRRKGCGHTELTPDANVRRCPKCKMKLWPVGQVRPLRSDSTRDPLAPAFAADPLLRPL
jgi:hypothetical protein